MENNQETIQKFTNSVYQGQQWVKEHSSREIAEEIKGFFPDTDVELLANVLQSYIDIDAWNETPILKEESYNLLQTVMEEAGELKTRAPYEKVVNNHYAEEAMNTK